MVVSPTGCLRAALIAISVAALASVAGRMTVSPNCLPALIASTPTFEPPAPTVMILSLCRSATTFSVATAHGSQSLTTTLVSGCTWRSWRACCAAVSGSKFAAAWATTLMFGYFALTVSLNVLRVIEA